MTCLSQHQHLFFRKSVQVGLDNAQTLMWTLWNYFHPSCSYRPYDSTLLYQCTTLQVIQGLWLSGEHLQYRTGEWGDNWSWCIISLIVNYTGAATNSMTSLKKKKTHQPPTHILEPINNLLNIVFCTIPHPEGKYVITIKSWLTKVLCLWLNKAEKLVQISEN